MTKQEIKYLLKLFQLFSYKLNLFIKKLVLKSKTFESKQVCESLQKNDPQM